MRRVGIPAVLESKAIGGLRRGRGFRGGAKASEQVATAGTGCGRSTEVGLLLLVDRRDLGGRRKAQSFDMVAFPPRMEAWPRDSNGAIERGLICHLSKTASVVAHVLAD